MDPCDFLIKSTDQPPEQSRHQRPFGERQPHQPVQAHPGAPHQAVDQRLVPPNQGRVTISVELRNSCLLYTSDAAAAMLPIHGPQKKAGPLAR